MRDARRFLGPAALVIALASLGLNLVLLDRLRSPDRWAIPAARRAIRSIAGADGIITRDITIPAGTEIDLEIPVDESFSIAVDTVIPINTTVRVPFDTPIGRRVVTLPIRADVPVRTTLPLDVRHTFRLRTRTPRDMRVPIRLRVGDLLDPSARPE